MSIVKDEMEVYRSVNLKLRPDVAKLLIAEIQKQIDNGAYPMVTVYGRVT